MLFKYLIGTVALAAIVTSSPTQSSSSVTAQVGGSFAFYDVQKSTYEQCVTTITEVKQPVISSCEAGQVDKVKKHLKKVTKHVHDVSANFQAYVEVEKVEVGKPVVIEQSRKFIEVLERFEEVLVVIQKHPRVSSGCTDVYLEFDAYFKSIVIQFDSHGVDIHKSIKESKIHWSVWERAGFGFYESSHYKWL